MMIHRRAPRSLLLAGMLLWASRALLKTNAGRGSQEMSLSRTATKLSVQLKIEGAYTVEASFLPAPPRLVVDLTPMPRIRVILHPDRRHRRPRCRTERIHAGNGPGRLAPESKRSSLYDRPRMLEGLRSPFWYEGEVPPLRRPSGSGSEARREADGAPAAAPNRKSPAVLTFSWPPRTGLAYSWAGTWPWTKISTCTVKPVPEPGTYSFSARPVFELQFGKYLNRIKLGLGVTAWSIKEPGAFTASLPHPFLADSNRTVSFQADDLKYPSWSFSAFALFSLLETDTIGLSAGPMIGLTMGKTSSLNDFNFTERSPFTSADIVVSDLTFVEEKFTEFLFGGLLGLEYRPTESLSILFDLRLNYLNPKNVNLNQRINLLHFQPVLGIQYNF